jgi:hypothetical protein
MPTNIAQEVGEGKITSVFDFQVNGWCRAANPIGQSRRRRMSSQNYSTPNGNNKG